MANSEIFAPVDPIYRIPNLPIDPTRLVERALDKFQQFEVDRVQWIKKREEFYLGWDDYQSPTRKGLWEGSANFHLPSTEIQCNAMHAQLMQGFFFINPIFFVDPQEELDNNRIKKIEYFMKYIIERGANYNNGIYNAIDDYCWDIVTDGMGILSRDWKILQRRFIDVERNPGFKDLRLNLESLLQEEMSETDFKSMANEILKRPYQEVPKIRTVFNGSIVVAEDPSHILFKGDVVDATDLNQHETVIKVCYFSENELIAFKNSEYMDEDAINIILEAGPDKIGSTTASQRTNRINTYKDVMTGIKTINANVEERKYEMICVYDTVPLSSKGKASIADRLVYFVHPKTKQLTRWTFLDRISENGKLPLHMGHLYRRPRRSTGRGMVETQYCMNEIEDMLVNQAIDTGMLVNNPMFAYKGNSSFDPEEVRVEPGLGIKADDPNSDIRFFNWNGNPNWSQPLIAMVQAHQQQITALGPSQMGQVGGRVGPLRSTSGVREMNGQSGIILDVVLRRVKEPVGQLFEGLYMDNQARMPEKMKITVTGQEGVPMMDQEGKYIYEDISREELSRRVHFGLYANSNNMNRIAQKEDAMQLCQFLFQPVMVQTGVVQPHNVYEAASELITTMGKGRLQRFLSKPSTGGAVSMEAELVSIMQGIMPPITMADPDHQIKIDRFQALLDSEQAQAEAANGMVNPKAMAVLQEAIKKHTEVLALAQRPSNLQNPTGSNVSPTGGNNLEQGDQSMPEPQSNGQPQGSSAANPESAQPEE